MNNEEEIKEGKIIQALTISGDRKLNVKFMPSFAIITEEYPEADEKNTIRIGFNEIETLCNKLKEVM